jgi:hypothetical protein
MASKLIDVLVLCETSDTVRGAFERAGFLAVSVDVLPSENKGALHLQQSVASPEVEILARRSRLIIAHPPCTYLTHSAEWAYGPGPYHQKVKPGTLVGYERQVARAEAVRFAQMIWEMGALHICIENPVGALSRPDALGPAAQYIQPYQFGHDASKKTGLWLKALPPLQPTAIVEPTLRANGKLRWGNQTDAGQNRLSPSEDRWQQRSKTYAGIADAMVQQWGPLLR